jgi:deoxyribodipyrimidine photo-lyase
MQSGTTGINTTRVYNPIKQAQDHDPQGRFVRAWLPALRRVPDEWLFEPWRMPASEQQRLGLQVGVDIATPVVDLALATREAKQRLYARRHTDEVKAGKQAVIDKHASRLKWRMDGERRASPRRVKPKIPVKGPPTSQASAQMGFDFE